MIFSRYIEMIVLLGYKVANRMEDIIKSITVNCSNDQDTVTLELKPGFSGPTEYHCPKDMDDIDELVSLDIEAECECDLCEPCDPCDPCEGGGPYVCVDYGTHRHEVDFENFSDYYQCFMRLFAINMYDGKYTTCTKSYPIIQLDGVPGINDCVIALVDRSDDSNDDNIKVLDLDPEQQLLRIKVSEEYLRYID